MSQGLALTALSVLSLLLGAVLPGWLRGGAWPGLWQGLVLGAVGGLVAVVVLPETVRVAGPAALLVAMIGVALPSLLGRAGASTRGLDERFTLGAALLALLIHTALDGVGLASAARPSSSGVALGLAIVAHRFPVGLALWLVALPRYGAKGAALILGLVGATTFVGYGIGDLVLPSAESTGLQLFQAFVAGSLFHVLLHTPEVPRRGRFRWDELIGTAVGLVFVALLPDAHGHGPVSGGDYGERLETLVLRAAPAVVLGFVLGAIVPLTLGSHRTLRRLMASPQLELPALCLSFPLLGLPLAFFRTTMSALLAVLGMRFGEALTEAERRPRPLEALAELVDRTAPGLLFGIVVAAALPPEAFRSSISNLPAWLEVCAFGLLGIVFRLSASGLMPIGAAFVSAGLTPGAAIAFVLATPRLTTKSPGSTHGTLRVQSASLVFAVAVATGLAANGLGLTAPSGVSVGDPASVLRWLAVAVATAFILWSLAREGARKYLSRVLWPDSLHEHHSSQVQSSQTPRT